MCRFVQGTDGLHCTLCNASHSADDTGERAEAARYNLTRLKLGDYQVQKRKLDARIRLLKEQLERQQDELQYYEEEMVTVQSRLHSALLRSQRASQASF